MERAVNSFQNDRKGGYGIQGSPYIGVIHHLLPKRTILCPKLHSEEWMPFKADLSGTLVPLCAFPESATCLWLCSSRLRVAKTAVSGLPIVQGLGNGRDQTLNIFRFAPPTPPFQPGYFVLQSVFFCLIFIPNVRSEDIQLSRYNYGFMSRQGQELFLCFTASRPPLKPT